MSKTFHLGTVEDEYGEAQLHFEPAPDDQTRNAPRDHRPSGGSSFMTGHNKGRFSLVRKPDARTPATRNPEPAPRSPRVTDQARPMANVADNGEYLAIRKDALIDLISIGGDAWASWLTRPDFPQATGDAKTDFDNASLHRDALALHDQNRDRVRTVSSLLERMARLLLS